MSLIKNRQRGFVWNFLPLLVFLGLGFGLAWKFGSFSQKSDSKSLVSEVQDSRHAMMESKIVQLGHELKLTSSQAYFIEDFRSLQDAFSRYALERRIKSPLPVLRTLLSQYYREIFDEHSSSKLAKTRVEDNVNLLSESTLAAQINYLQRANGDNREYVNDGTRWSEIHGRRYSDWKLWAQGLGADNFHWIDIERHDVFFSVNKDLEFATSLKYGPFSESHLAKFVAQVLASPKKGELLMSDLDSEILRWDEFRTYVGMAVESDGRRVGAIVVEFSRDKLKTFLQSKVKEGLSEYEYLVDASDYKFWVPPADLKHPSRSPSEPHKLQLLQWMDASRTRSGTDRWISFMRNESPWIGSVKPVSAFNQDLWIVHEYPATQLENPLPFARADFSLAFGFAVLAAVGFAFWRARHDPGSPTTREAFKQDQGLQSSNGNVLPSKKPAPVLRKINWELIEEPLGKVERQLAREFENLKVFADELKNHRIQIQQFSKICDEMKVKIKKQSESLQPVIAEVEDKIIPQDNLQFPTSWIESVNTSVRKLELISFGLTLEIKKSGNTLNPSFGLLNEELAVIQRKLQREMATLEKWGMQLSNPVDRIPLQTKLIEFSQVLQSMENLANKSLERVSRQSFETNEVFNKLLRTFIDLRKQEGLTGAVAAIKTSLEIIKADEFSVQLANAETAEVDFQSAQEIESYFRAVDPVLEKKNEKKTA